MEDENVDKRGVDNLLEGSLSVRSFWINNATFEGANIWILLGRSCLFGRRCFCAFFQ